MKKNRFFLGLIFAAILACGAYFLFFEKKPVSVPYKTFYNEVSEGKISEATIFPDKINFKYAGGENVYSTENPDSPK